MKKIKLNNGVEMPILGYGVYQIPKEETENAVLNALKIGYRLIDTAQAYKNEKEVGDAIKKSGIPREKLFITTKLWVSHFSYENAKIAFNESLQKLGLEYIDLYLLHQPYGDVHGAWKALEEFYKQGKIKAIGVSNFSNYRIVDLTEYNTIKPAVNQIEINPLHQRDKEVEYQSKYGVALEAWAPFAEGKSNLFTNEILVKIGKAHNKTAAQVMLRWLIQKDIVVIPKSVHPERMEQNFNVFDFELSVNEMKQIKELDLKTSQFFDHEEPETVKFIKNWTTK